MHLLQPPKSSESNSWTLRFKNHKTTVLLEVRPSQSLSTIKEELLDSIKATGRKEINGSALPDSSEEIVLGVPVDKNDPSQGWLSLEDIDFDGLDKKTKGGLPLAEAGLRDGAVVAFKFAVDDDDNEWDVVMASYEDEAMSP